ncbi:MAG TPA: hypothetical protein VE967_02250 [Gemmatimonadaceae bacterium]|nr:hypothetical protein [Gemmatimonadaceae bacterium]
MLRAFIAATATLMAVAGTEIAAQSADAPSQSGGAIALQVGVGVPSSLVGFVVGGLAVRRVAHKFGSDDERAGRIAYAGGFAGAALTTGLTTKLLGSRDATIGDTKVKVHGSYAAAVGGAVCGEIAAALIRKIGRKGALGERGPIALLAGVAMFVLPSAGSSIAFAQTRKR